MVENKKPGIIALIGSGETTRFGGQVFERLIRNYPTGSRISVLETPAGFELNSPLVAGKVAEFLRSRLQNYSPDVQVIPARRRGTEQSPDSLNAIRPMSGSALIFMGPGSPSYAIRQLHDSLAWELLQADYLQGTSLAFASAAAIAIGKYALPVYEIYKVGEDPHWLKGLDILGAFGLPAAIIPHWNNHEGGAGLDTSHCFIGKRRFEQMVELLPKGVTVIGIDELTTLVIDLVDQRCDVMGHGQVHLIRDGNTVDYDTRTSIEIPGLGFHPQKTKSHRSVGIQELLDGNLPADQTGDIPRAVSILIKERERARERGDWTTADHLRDQIEALGWQISDTPEGPDLSTNRE